MIYRVVAKMPKLLERLKLKHLLVFSTASIALLLLVASALFQPADSYALTPADPNPIASPSNATLVQAPMEPQEIVYETFTPDNYSADAINAALLDCPNGQVVKLAAGTYLLNDVIYVPECKILAGSMDETGKLGTVITTNLTDGSVRSNGCIDIGSGNNTVKNIKTLNGYYFYGLNSHDFLFQDCEYNGPTNPTAGRDCLYGFFVYLAANGNYDNGCFLRCVANNAPCFGFLVGADGSKNSDHFGPNAYSARCWSWIDCQAYGCGIANGNYLSNFVYGCGFDFFEGFGFQDNVDGMRVTGCVANGNEADGFHIEYKMNITDCIFANCTANDNGQWFKSGRTTNPGAGVLIGTGFYLGGAVISQTQVINCLAQNNWGYSTMAGGYGIFDSEFNSDLDGTYAQGTGAVFRLG